MPGCGALAGFAGEAAGEDDRYAGACDDEVAGAVAAWDRVEAYAAARKHAAVAEFIRRRPRHGSPLQGPARMPESWDESITAEVAGVLAESRSAADAMLDLAHDLEVKLPGTKAAFYDGVLRQSKVAIIARALLDLLLGRDSRPGQGGAAAPGAGPAGGVAARLNLTVPLATVTGLADRPGEMAGIGPIDPDPGANTPDRYQTGHQPTAGIQHINVPDRCLRRVGNWCASRPLTCGSNRLIDDRQVRAYVGGLPVFAVDRIRVRAPMSADPLDQRGSEPARHLRPRGLEHAEAADLLVAVPGWMSWPRT